MSVTRSENTMEEDTSNASSTNKYAKLLEGSWWSQFRHGSNPWMARYVYGVMFLLANLLAWAVRDYGPSALTEMKSKIDFISGFVICIYCLGMIDFHLHWTTKQLVMNGTTLNMKTTLKSCISFQGSLFTDITVDWLKSCQGGKDCLGTEGVLRVSLGCFIFYFIMFLSTCGTSKLHGRKELWHSGWWSAKVFLMIALMVLPFFLPTEMILIYGDIAHFGAGVFLLIQLISIISFITWLNDFCLSEKYAERCQIHCMLLATTAYVVCILGIILMYIWYTPQPTCLLNIFFITWTLVLLQLMTSVSLHPKVSAGFLTPGFMGLYVVFLCWSAIRSEPADDKCVRKSEASRDWLTIISFIVAVIAIVIATFSTGIDSQCFQFKKEERQDEDDVPYGFGFFHFVFATGAMYFAMLLIGWNSHHPMKKWTIDVGWTSTWVRIVNEWLAVCIYLWMLVAPIVWKSRQVEAPS